MPSPTESWRLAHPVLVGQPIKVPLHHCAYEAFVTYIKVGLLRAVSALPLILHQP
jgi:hypothetical protein